MEKKKLNFLFFAMLIYLLGGLISTFVSGYLLVQYFNLSKAKWYLADISITVLDIVGLLVTLIILIKKSTDNKKIILYRFFITLGLLGVSLLIILRFYFQIVIPNFPPKLSVASLILDGILIKIIFDQKM